MLFALVRKDTLLVKKYMLIMLFAAIILPVFIKLKTDFLVSGGAFAFFMSTLFIQYILFNSVSTVEYKYKGSILLSATPYGRKAQVQSKYLFLMLLFISCYLLYTLTALLFPRQMELLSLADLGSSLLILALVFSILIPVQYKFGFEKAKYIFFFGIFMTPFVTPILLNYIQERDISLQLHLPLPTLANAAVPVVLALAISIISMKVATRIYEKQNL